MLFLAPHSGQCHSKDFFLVFSLNLLVKLGLAGKTVKVQLFNFNSANIMPPDKENV